MSSRFALASSLAALSLAALGGCSSPAPASSRSSAGALQVTDQSSPDLTVLRASPGVRIDRFDASECTDLQGDQYSQTMDCTAAFEARYGIPALHKIVVWNNPEWSCELLTVTTVTRAAAFAAADGIGFYYSDGDMNIGDGRFVAKADLVVDGAGTATLKNGEAAVLHKFGGLAECFRGDGTSSEEAEYRFKPYVRFTSGDQQYNNWDVANDDYVISFARGTRFDRSAELLQ